MTRDEIPPLHPDAVGYSAFRCLKSGAGRAYSSVEFTSGWADADHFLRQLRAVGYVRASTKDADGYAVLDVLDAAGDVIQDYDIPHQRAFAYIKRKLRLVVAGGAEEAGE